jgi:hypothetical protein
MRIVGRLKPGVTVWAAQAEFTALERQLEKHHPERNGIIPRLMPLARHVSGPLRPALFVLACAVAVMILIVYADSFEPATSEVERAAKGNGDADGIGSGAFPAAAADDN